MKEFIDGNEAIARAAIQAGCNFFAGYPITPATSILLYMTRELPKVGGIAIQGEDEIASMGFCIGAALAGRRVMTATSGPGLSLYCESIGAAIMVEIPMVIVDVQRMGPATGGPTIGSYGDIQFVRWGNSGGFPIIALTPASVTDCFNLTIKAFELADRFRVPVFILSDKETGLTKESVDTSRFAIPDVMTWGSNGGSAHPGANSAAVLPLVPFGGSQLIRLTTSSHTPDGYLTKDTVAIRNHNEHLIAKINAHLDEIAMVHYDQQHGADTLIISYGISARAVEAAVHQARSQRKPVSSLTIYSLWPVPEEEIRAALKPVRRVIIPELNLGLYRREIERLVRNHHEIIGLTCIDGRMISPAEIMNAI